MRSGRFLTLAFALIMTPVTHHATSRISESDPRVIMGDSNGHRSAMTEDRDVFLKSKVLDLGSLARFAVSDDVVTVGVFNVAYRKWATNWYYALSKYGGGKEVLLAAFDPDSLTMCLSLGFACYDGRLLLRSKENLTADSVAPDNGDTKPDYRKLTWAKPLLIEAVLKLGYKVLFSDLDTVWVKHAVTSMTRALDKHEADVVGMSDKGKEFVNTGNMLFRSNARTLRLLSEWIRSGYDTQPAPLKAASRSQGRSREQQRPDRKKQKGGGRERNSEIHIRQTQTSDHVGHTSRELLSDSLDASAPLPTRETSTDQKGFNLLYDILWLACKDAQRCKALVARDKVALWTSPCHGRAIENTQSPLCDDKYAYIHMIGKPALGAEPKARVAADLGLWFVRPSDEPSAPFHNLSARWKDLIADKEPSFAGRNFSLPCANSIAWP